MIVGDTDVVLASKSFGKYKGQVQLVFTSPPFPLNRKKAYGNLTGATYVDWLAAFAPRLREYLAPGGSIVLELGNSWEKGQPTMSTFGLRAFLSFLDKGELNLCQQFVCFNPARLPSPIQWVNKDRIRVKDSFTHVWWMAPTTRPKADNRAVLNGYSQRMLQLLKKQKYNSGKRPSEHGIGARSFLTDNGGAIPPNVLAFSNTRSNDPYQKYCREQDIEPHPARMPAGLVDFFVRLLTSEGDLVLDPFAGSNTTGAVAEGLGRRWLAIEKNQDYVDGSRGRFLARRTPAKSGQ